MISFNQKPPLNDIYYTIGKIAVGFTALLLILRFSILTTQPWVGVVVILFLSACYFFVVRTLWNGGEELLASLMLGVILFHLLLGLAYSYFSFQSINQTYRDMQGFSQLLGIITFLVCIFDIAISICFFIKGFKRGKHLVLMGVAFCLPPIFRFMSTFLHVVYFYRIGIDIETVGMVISIVTVSTNIILLIAIFHLLHQEQKIQQQSLEESFDKRIF